MTDQQQPPVAPEPDGIPERLFAKACHPERPNKNCSWSVSKEPIEGSVEYARVQPVDDARIGVDWKLIAAEFCEILEDLSIYTTSMCWCTRPPAFNSPHSDVCQRVLAVYTRMSVLKSEVRNG